MGLGLYAKVCIPKGTRIVPYNGERLRRDDVEKDKGRYYLLLMINGQ
jgi:SET domain-containing protein